MMGKKIIIICLLAGSMVFSPGLSRAEEPSIPGLDQTFSSEKEKKIDELTDKPIPAVFSSLTSAAFFDEEAYLNKAIYRAFNHRSAEAIQFALGHIRLPQVKTSLTSAKEFYIAKQTLHLFSDQALDHLLDLYTSGGPKVRKNVVEAIGQMAGEQSIRAVLVNALDDDSFCEDSGPESVGEPLRICDVAYNQTVMRYKIKNVPRVIGSVHAIDMRDQNIRALKDLVVRTEKLEHRE